MDRFVANYRPVNFKVTNQGCQLKADFPLFLLTQKLYIGSTLNGFFSEKVPTYAFLRQIDNHRKNAVKLTTVVLSPN